MFEISVEGLAQLEGGKPPARLACEPIANVFDEYRGYADGRRKPTECRVTMHRHETGRGVWLIVADDGPGFEDARDIWTLFGTTAKRDAPNVAGRFNCGDKQLIATARTAIVESGSLRVTFADGKRTTANTAGHGGGVTVSALMPWSLAEMAGVRETLRGVIPPLGLAYTVDGFDVIRPLAKCSVRATLPTVQLVDGVLRETVRKTLVDVYAPAIEGEPMLYELGMPVCSIVDLGFRWSLDVQQKIPVPISRDSVTPAYLFRLIGSVVEQAAMDGVTLVSDEDQSAGFLRRALDWVREPGALQSTVAAVYGADAVRVSSDVVANVQATAAGAPLVSGRWFTPETRGRLDACHALPTAKERFGGTDPQQPADGGKLCPTCNGRGRLAPK